MDSQFFQNPQVLIVGAGPTGLVLAYELARRGIRARLIDKDQGPAEQSRALAIQVRTLEIFHFMGILEEVLQKGQAIGHINLFTHKKLLFQAQFRGLKSPYPFPLILPQNDTEAILLAALRKLGVEVERDTELLEFQQEGERVLGTLRKSNTKERFECAWLVGCDGAHSVVRRSLNLEFKGAAYPQLFSLADVELKSELKQNELSFFFDKDGFFGVFPMRKGWVRLLAVDPLGKKRAPGENPSVDEFQAWADHFLPGKATIQKTYWLSDFRLHHRGVSTYQKGRVFIAGDAAHIHSPAGGQGMNTGIQDSFNLGWKLAGVIQQSLAPEILETYSKERQPVGAHVLKSTDRFFSVMVSQSVIARFIRSFIFPFIAQYILPKAMHKMAYFVSQLQVNYRTSSIVAQTPDQAWARETPCPGERAPDAVFVGGNQDSKKLFDLFQESKFTLLVFNAHPAVFEEISREFGNVFEVVKVSGAEISKIYGIAEEGVYLIRPDAYVAYRQQGFDFIFFKNYLKKCFVSSLK